MVSNVELFRDAENLKGLIQVKREAWQLTGDPELLAEAVHLSWLRILSMVLLRQMTGW